MKSFYESKTYIDDIKRNYQGINIEFFSKSKFLISGSTGLICSYLIDSLLLSKEFHGEIYAITTNLEKAQKRFSNFYTDHRLKFLVQDIKDPINLSTKVDYVIHGASYTDPLGYSKHPIDTMLINICGTKNMLDYAYASNAKFMFLSSCEIYGTSSKEILNELDYGFIDSMEVRSCYNESKKASETLSVSYSVEKNVFIIVPRFSRCFGPTMRIDDTKALSQFIRKGLANEDIVLKSEGKQEFSYIYVSDAVSAIFFLLENGQNREAYNVTNREIKSLRNLAQYVADIANTHVVFDFADDFKGTGYSKAQKAIQDIAKIEQLKWSPSISIINGLITTISILKEVYN